MKKNNTINFINIAKGIGIILVMMVHSNMCSTPPLPILKLLLSFVLPLFFIISGYLYDQEKWENLGIKKLIQKRWKMYVVPYFILSFFNLFLNMPVEYIRGIHGEKLLLSTIHHIFWIFYSYGSATTTPNCTPLWFLPCLFICSIYFYVLLKIKNVSVRIIVCTLSSLLECCLSYYHVFQFPWHIEVAFIGTCFMYIGFVIKKYNLLFINSIDLITILAFFIIGCYAILQNDYVDINANIINNIILLYIGSIMIGYSILYICAHYIKQSKFLSFFGQNTIIILGFNYALNTYTSAIWNRLPFCSALVYQWWIVLIVDIVCFSIIILINKKLKNLLYTLRILKHK